MTGLDHDLLKLQPDWLDADRPRLGRYVLGPLLGKGGMGEVLEAWDVVLCRTVALKVLKNLEATAVIRFMHEAQLQARIVHPNICRIYDVDATEGNVKIAMQLVRGPNLEQAARELSISEVVTLMAQVAEAVHAAHRLKLIHRDLKPSNILLERGEDGRWFPYICDFGLAMAMDEPSLTYTNSVLGTPAYMAPEQLHGQRDLVGPATDVYGLGGTLHYALMGWAPDGPTPPAGLSTRGNQPLARPLTQELPKDLKTIIRKCLEGEPELRYPTASALADDLWCLLNGQPIRGTVAGPGVRAWRRLRAYRWPVASLLVAAAVLGAGWRLEMARDAQVLARTPELEWFLGRDLAEVEQDLRMERMLPLHDLRPAYARVEDRLARMTARTALAGEAISGPGHAAQARLYLQMGSGDKALAEIGQARAAGFRTSETAGLAGAALAMRSLESGVTPSAQELKDMGIDALLGQRSGAPGGRLDDAFAAFLRQDYLRASAEAFSTLQANPWSGLAGWLEGVSQTAQGWRMYEGGDLAGAEARFREALGSTERFLARAPSHEWVQHAHLLAARGLCRAQLQRGSLAPEALAGFQSQSERALGLDPGSADLQDDWLALQVLRADLLEQRGEDPGRVLAAAWEFASSRPRRPLAPGLRFQRLAVQYRLAQRALDRGGDPGVDFDQALRDLGTLPGLEPDPVPAALLLKARLERARGADPRPTLAEALSRLGPRPEERGAWSACETAGEAWLMRAEWEAAHRLDPAESLQRAGSLAATAVQMNPRSASALALQGLVALVARGSVDDPGREGLEQARERLAQSRAVTVGGRLQSLLARRLARAAG